MSWVTSKILWCLRHFSHYKYDKTGICPCLKFAQIVTKKIKKKRKEKGTAICSRTEIFKDRA